VADCRLKTARSPADVAEALAEGPLIARGNGRSYGDPALSRHLTLSMTGMDRMLSFDAETGTLVAEAGVLLSDIIATFLPRGWFPWSRRERSSSPRRGHRSGCAWQEPPRAGSFPVLRRLGRRDGRRRHRAPDRQARPRSLRPICGAMGLTGVILRAAIRLQPVETGWIRAGHDRRPKAFGRGHRRLRREPRRAPYSVAWIDCIGHPPRLGRSLVMLGRHATDVELPRKAPPQTVRDTGTPAAGRAVRPAHIRPECRDLRLFNAVYYALGRRKAGRSPDRLGPVFLPARLHVRNWNRIYGRAGFYQFQCALPLDGVRAALEQMLIDISEAGTGSFLSVLKRFGKGAGRFPSRSKATRWRLISRPMTGAAR
jgi:decaprenylphospho-beta-D-ribofuranose 2-oxidase